MTELKARKKTHEVISAEEFVRRFKADPNKVSGAKIVAPKLGGKSLGGRFEVPMDRPVYEAFVDE